jgi:hypothetical protein
MYFAPSNQFKPLNLVDQSQEPVTNALPVRCVRWVTFALSYPVWPVSRGVRAAERRSPGTGQRAGGPQMNSRLRDDDGETYAITCKALGMA